MQVPEEARNGSDPMKLELWTPVSCPTWMLGTKPESSANALIPSRLIYPASLSGFLAADPHGGLPTNSGGHWRAKFTPDIAFILLFFFAKRLRVF